MTSRRDQLQSYQFMNQRVISAFVVRETDPAQSPLRRGIGALFAGLMVAVLVAAGFGIYGVFTRTGPDRWQTDGSVVVERETGASFVYLRDKLHPALNLTSAKLAAGRPAPQVFRIAAKSLTGVPRGVTIGIAGAPSSLPEAKQQVRLPWTMCAIPGDQPSAVLVVGGTGPPGAALGDRALLVAGDGGGGANLVWQGRKHLIRNARTTVAALFGAVQPTRVGVAWLNALPAGADIAPVDVDDRGQESDAAAAFDNGDVLVVETGSGRQFYLVLADRLAPITPLQQAVLAAAFPGEPRQIPVSDLDPDAVQDLDPGADPAVQGPKEVPALATVAAGETGCAITRDAAAPPDVTVGGPAADLAAAVPTGGATGGGGRALADAVQVPGGRFALVRVAGGLQLITDAGVRHPLSDPDVAALLGYPPETAIDVPAALVNAVPAGVTLDPAEAVKPVPPTAE
ncbi:type VII secretion protein EccB [Actinoplanes sp. DH11]|uniref:type VII secretion protein EccB n=1 Tax=Actinoplanes sp. DH11 TaxID=2857011 RepID=UPI001E423805|nr:type VII secretion protein EccB [Actinoplanes sp. DH11]